MDIKLKVMAIAVLLTAAGLSTKAQYLQVSSKDSINGKPTYEGMIKGRLKLNGIYDIKGNLHGNSSFLIHENDVNGKNKPGMWMDMRQSQLRFDGIRRFNNGKELFTRLEADFEGGPDNRSTFRIRHAYVQYDHFTIGQTWSTFGDGDMWPAAMLDWDGPTGMVESRRPMIRYTNNLNKKIVYELAAELMEPRRLSDYTKTETVQYAARRLPDFIGTLKYNFNPGFVKVAAIYRNIGYTAIQLDEKNNAIADEYKSAEGYGVSVMANLFFAEHKKNNLQLQFNHGKGIADYFLAVGGSGLDGTADIVEQSKLRLLPVTSAYGAYQHYLTKTVHMMFVASFNNFDGTNSTIGWNKMQNFYAGGNLMFDVAPGLTVGAEYLWGRKKLSYADNTSKSFDAQRINFGILYNF